MALAGPRAGVILPAAWLIEDGPGGLSGHEGLAGIIIGQALYTGALDLADAIETAARLSHRAPGESEYVGQEDHPCLDVKDGRVVKGVNFLNLRDAGDPVEQAAAYSEMGADEIVFLDITASHERRGTVVDMVQKVAEAVFIPFAVGGASAP